MLFKPMISCKQMLILFVESCWALTLCPPVYKSGDSWPHLSSGIQSWAGSWTFVQCKLVKWLNICYQKHYSCCVQSFLCLFNDYMCLLWLRRMLWEKSRAPSQYKDILSRYGDSHVKDKTVMRPSYSLHGDPYTGKTASLYWNSPSTQFS